MHFNDETGAAIKIYSRSLPSLSFAVLITASADEVCDARNDAMKCRSWKQENNAASLRPLKK